MAKTYPVIIAGAGIGGVATAIMLGRAGIDYLILDKATTIRPLGSAIVLSAQVLRLFEQLGLYKELEALSVPYSGGAYFTQKDLKKIGELKAVNFEERYGYHSRLFARYDLIAFLVSKVPATKILWGKKILSTMQNNLGVLVRCSDGTTYDGFVLVGADGAYSAVRQSLYQNMTLKKMALPASDLERLRFDQFSIVGVTRPLVDWRILDLHDDFSRMDMVISDKQDYNLYAIPLTRSRIAWTFGGKILGKYRNTSDASFRLSDWSHQSIDDMKSELRDIPAPLVGTLGFLMDNTENISTIMLEDKLFKTWTEGRTVLIGDAAHKSVPAGGQGANLAVLDGLCLVNLLYEMHTQLSWTHENIVRVFETYAKIRSPHAKQAIQISNYTNKAICWKGWWANVVRSTILNLPEIAYTMSYDRSFAGRPQLEFLPKVPLRGSVPDSSKPHSLGLKSGEAKRRKSDETLCN